MARETMSRGLIWRCQSSATVSELKMTSERAAASSSMTGDRDRPGMRMNGASSLGSPSGGADVGDALIDLPTDFLDRQLLHPQRMIFGVRADGMPFLMNPAHHTRVRLRHLADQEIGRLDALLGEDIEHLVRIRRQRPVVESENHFLIRERQALRILHHANLRQFAGFKHQHAAGAERVRLAGTFLRPCRLGNR